MVSNASVQNWGLGEFALGTFVADATASQSVTFSSNSNGVLTALQLRHLAPPPPVPEPGTALFGLALLGTALTRRTRK